MSEPGVDTPLGDGEAHVSLPGRGITVSSRVEDVDGDTLVLRPSVGEFVGQTVVAVGSQVEVQWQRPQEMRSAPAEITAVEQGAVLRWRLRLTGPAELTQRRNHVRSRIVLPAELGLGTLEFEAETADLSEAGARVSLDGFGLLPDHGTPVDLRIEVDGVPLGIKGEVIRATSRGARWTLSVRFVGLPERQEDRLRRRVFQALREERARLAD
jgi:c-di-GMP-binding flagellar brake protein YcgR